jgi:ligand-binding sensor domain-containing protein
MFCDHQDFMWFGTMDGLNRYDAYSFKIIKSEPGKKNVLTNNRVSSIWEDELKFLWVKTYDGYYHYYIRETGEFINFPDYNEIIEEKNSIISCYHEEKKGSVWLGTSNSGLYHLSYNNETKRYQSKRFNSSGNNALSNNSISFVLSDSNDINWIGTQNGLNAIDSNATVKQLLRTTNFTCGALVDDNLYMGTYKGGITVYNTSSLSLLAAKQLDGNAEIGKVRFIEKLADNSLLFGTENKGLFHYQTSNKKLKQYHKFGNNAQYVFTDSYGIIWLRTEDFGIVKIDVNLGVEKHFDLIKKEKFSIIDDERPFIYEDRNRNLWIGIHGGGLALYNRENDSFSFYKNNPLSDNTLSSDFVHCIGEDRSGMLWVGTGQFNGGANKVILANPSFTQIIPEKNLENLADNVVRCLFEDSNKNTWMATKSGSIYIYNSNNELIKKIDNLHVLKEDLPGYNIYSILEDHEGYIWLGSKGGGVLVSSKPITKGNKFYEKLSFNLYQKESRRIK